jgi:hypothetical protein
MTSRRPVRRRSSQHCAKATKWRSKDWWSAIGGSASRTAIAWSARTVAVDEPVNDAGTDDPAARYLRESVALAFLAALQHLPGTQRARKTVEQRVAGRSQQAELAELGSDGQRQLAASFVPHGGRRPRGLAGQSAYLAPRERHRQGIDNFLVRYATATEWIFLRTGYLWRARRRTICGRYRGDGAAVLSRMTSSVGRTR